jgi:hypothetical protein
MHCLTEVFFLSLYLFSVVTLHHEVLNRGIFRPLTRLADVLEVRDVSSHVHPAGIVEWFDDIVYVVVILADGALNLKAFFC